MKPILSESGFLFGKRCKQRRANIIMVESICIRGPGIWLRVSREAASNGNFHDYIAVEPTLAGLVVAIFE